MSFNSLDKILESHSSWKGQSLTQEFHNRIEMHEAYPLKYRVLLGFYSDLRLGIIE